MCVDLLVAGRGSGATLGRGRLLPGRGFRLRIIHVESVFSFVFPSCDACAAACGSILV